MRKSQFLKIVIFGSFLICFSCNNYLTVPDLLVGVWTTSQDPYKDRPFVIQKESILFIQGNEPGDYLHCPISSVQKEEKGNKVLYTIVYIINNEEYTLSFYYQPINGGRIRFKNQPKILWTITSPPERIQNILSSLDN